MSTNFDFDLLNEAVENAPTVGFGPRITYGKMTIADIQITSWERKAKGEKGTIKQRTFTRGEQLKDGEYLQITFAVDVKELNPTLDFEYKRRVDVRNSGGKVKTDWSEIVQPSLIAQIGKDWAKKLAKGLYVEVEDAETVVLDKSGAPKSWTKTKGDGTEATYVNTAPRITAVYKSKAECDAARQARFAKSEATDGEENDGDIPAKVIADVRGLLKAVDEEQAKTILTENAPYNQYDLDELLAAANKVPF